MCSIAEIDSTKFIKVGLIPSSIGVLIKEKQVFSIKSLPCEITDPKIGAEHVLFFSIDPEALNEFLIPSYVYKLINDNSKNFVEVQYHASIGLIDIDIYFLVESSQCSFTLLDFSDPLSLIPHTNLSFNNIRHLIGSV